ncbi:mycothiol system anti-sigma-R factor [Actinomadura sp. 3N407]|uniref:mycothiol system anti-sigma-R factor n=1 Tax=Actinomadura sp. 3N407 TaxID=3457423 RepID=UPI003FCD7F19
MRDCANFLTKADLYLDGELDDVAMAEVRDHLGECPNCLREYGLHQALQTMVGQAGGGDFAPTDLHGKILSRLAQLGADEGTNPPSERVRIGGGWEASTP